MTFYSAKYYHILNYPMRIITGPAIRAQQYGPEDLGSFYEFGCGTQLVPLLLCPRYEVLSTNFQPVT